MTHWNKDKVSELLLQSGAVALKYFDSPRLSYKKDQTVVTQADREIENLLAATLDKPEEGSYLLGEETLEGRSEDYIKGALGGTAWIVEGKLNYRNDPKMKDKDPGAFKMYAVPLPKP